MFQAHSFVRQLRHRAGFSVDGLELVLDCAAIVARPCLAGRLQAPGLLSRNVFDQVTGIARALALERSAMAGRIGYLLSCRCVLFFS